MKIELVDDTKIATIKVVVYWGVKPTIKEKGVYYMKAPAPDALDLFKVFSRVDKKFNSALGQVQKIELYLFRCKYNKASLFLPLIEAGKKKARSKVIVMEEEDIDKLQRSLTHWKKRRD